MIGCALPRPAASLAEHRDHAYVAVLSGEMPPPIDQVARHAWIVTHVPGERDRRFEYDTSGHDDDALEYYPGGDVMLHGVVRASPSDVRAKIRCLERASTEAGELHPGYFPIPGPNSNTYVDILLRRCAIAVELPATAIGRDYRGIAGASVTESRTGVQFESILLGFRLGLVDGIELHLFGLAFGLHFWPPGITLPINPGRLGFASDAHVSRPRDIEHPHVRSIVHGWLGEHDEHDPKREYGLASIWLALGGARTIDPAKVGGLEGRVTAGFQARAIYGSRVGYGFGADLDLGGGIPASFAYSMHLFPAGLCVMFGPTGYAGLFAGIGTSGVTTLAPPALEIPLEARLEVDASAYARIGLRASASWNIGTSMRQQSALASPWAHEIAFGAFARFGKTWTYERGGYAGSGYFIALERRELMGSAWLGFSFGVETDAAW